MNEQDLMNLKEEISEAKTEISKLEGSKQVLLQQAKEKYQCNTIVELEKKLSKWKTDGEKLNTQILEGLAELEATMEGEG